MLIRLRLLWNEAFVLLPQPLKLLLHFLYGPEVRWDVGIIARPKTSAQLDQMDRNSIPTRSRIGCNCLNGVGSFVGSNPISSTKIKMGPASYAVRIVGCRILYGCVSEILNLRVARDSGAIPKGVAETAVAGSLRRVPDASHDFGAHPIESLAPYLSPLHCAESETLDGSPDRWLIEWLCPHFGIQFFEWRDIHRV